jgi:hypothetical protein
MRGEQESVRAQNAGGDYADRTAQHGGYMSFGVVVQTEMSLDGVCQVLGGRGMYMYRSGCWQMPGLAG